MKNRWKKAVTTAIALVSGVAVIGMSACSTEGTTGAKKSSSAHETADAVITLSDRGSTVSDAEGSNKADDVKVNGNKIEITDEGTYEISGSLSDGQIYVEASDEDTVTLLLNGADITNKTEPAIYAENAKEVRISLVDGSENLLQSGTSMPETADENASGGTVFCRDDLIISGTGSLTVNGYINDGIHGNDDLTIENGTIEVNAIHHAVKTNETLTVENGSLALTSGTDGIHSEDELVITGGNITINAGDDGIHAETDLTIEDGTIEITDSYEGIESNRIYVESGDISITSRDDGFNANGGQSFFGFGTRPGQQTEESDETSDPELIINGGTIYVNADGDGLDSNGDLIVNDGEIIVDGPESSANGALDSGTENGGVCQVNGGTVLAIGASGMAERFGDSSLQPTFFLRFNTADAGSTIRIENLSGKEIFTYTSAKSFSSLVFSSPEIEVGEDYVVTVGSESISFTQESTSYYDSSAQAIGGGSFGQGGSAGGSSNRPDSGTGGRSNRPNSGTDNRGDRSDTPGDDVPSTPEGDSPSIPEGDAPSMPEGDSSSIPGGDAPSMPEGSSL